MYISNEVSTLCYSLVVLFYVQRADGEYVNALEMVETLNQKFKSNIDFANFNAKRADTYCKLYQLMLG